MKKEKISKIIKERGITLTTLVVTIVILIILIGITLGSSLGENGIIAKTKKSVEFYEKEQDSEAKKNNVLAIELANVKEDDLLTTYSELKSIINQIVDEKILEKYPVGSIYISTSSTNPSGFLGGTWESYGQGRTLIGNGTNGEYSFTAGSTGTTVGATTNPLGEYVHKLTVAEMPSHSHSYAMDVFESTSITFRQSITGPVDGSKHDGWGPQTGFIKGTGPGTFYIKSNGGSGSHNNIQPYIVVYMWKRVG